MERVKLLGVGFDAVDMKEALSKVEALIREDRAALVVTPNPEMLVNASEVPELKVALNAADLVIADGIGVIYGAKMQGKPLHQRVTGIDLMTEILNSLSKSGGSYFLFGSKPGVAEQASKRIDRMFPGIRCAGYTDGYFKPEQEAGIIETINAAKPDVLFVGLGSPKQEVWAHKHLGELHAPVCMCIGGAFDVYSGNVERAPSWVMKIGFEWLYRAIKEPVRFKRLLKIPIFLVKVIKEKE
ncbi:MAG: WecB/TagA/CpsF family glycosyltransferase [Bacillota bacterium]|nr:WecB/TagA/CpsF family glycosyltransferase [Bacillota bacterium]